MDTNLIGLLSLLFSGVMKISHLDSLYRNSTRISKFILSLLNKFEVALQFDKDNLILPSLLPTDKNLKPTMMKEVSEPCDENTNLNYQGPVVQSVVSLTSSLRVISLTVLADSIYNILIFFAEKM